MESERPRSKWKDVCNVGMKVQSWSWKPKNLLVENDKLSCMRRNLYRFEIEDARPTESQRVEYVEEVAPDGSET